MVELVTRDIRYAARSLRRNPGFALTVIFTLALGIGANAAIFNLLHAIILRALPVPEPQQLRLFAVQTDKEHGEPIFSYPVLRQMQQTTTGKASLAGFSSIMQAQLLADAGESQRVGAQLVTGNFFQTLRVRAEAGHLLNPEDDRASGTYPAVLSDAYWTSHFGKDPGVIGRVVSLNQTPAIIVGVAAPGFFGVLPGSEPAFWLPVSAQHDVRYLQNVWNSNGDGDKSFLPQPQIRWLEIIARIPNARNEPHVVAAVNQIYTRDMQREVQGRSDPVLRQDMLRWRVRLESGSKGLGDLRHRYEAPLFVLMAAAGLVLLIACANIGSLALARAAARRKEFAVRSSVGATRMQITGQFVIEALLLALAGGAVSIPITLGASHLLLVWASNGHAMPLDISLRAPVLAFVGLASVVIGFLFGTLPATEAVRISLAEALKSQATSLAGMRLPWGRTLIAAQVMFSFVLLTGAVLFVRTLMNYMHVRLGFTPERVITVQIDPLGAHYSVDQLIPAYHRVLDRVKQVPGVESAAFDTSGLDLNHRTVSGFNIAGHPAKPGEDQSIQEDTVSPGYFETVGMRLLAGRVFTAHDIAKKPVFAVINETAARTYFQGIDKALGQHFGYGKDTQFEIIGVVADARVNDVHAPAPPMAYYSLLQNPTFVSHLEVRAQRNPKSIEGAIRAAIHRADPNLPVIQVKLLSDQVSSNLDRERLLARLASAFALLALALASLGVYGMLSYSIARRTSEIGIRMALGAEQSSVRWMVLDEALRVIAIGLVVGVPAALSITRLAKGLLFGISPEDPLSIAAGAVCLLVIGTAAALIPAWRASGVDPMTALRYE